MDHTKYSERRIWLVKDVSLLDENEVQGLMTLIKKISDLMRPVAQQAGTPLQIGFLQGLKGKGKVYIIGHGSPSTVGDLTPHEMAYQLVSRGGLQSGSTVRLVSCNTAFSKWVFWEDSYAKKLKKELAKRGADCEVVGQAGIATLTPTGSIRTMRVYEWGPHPKNPARQIPVQSTTLGKGVGKRRY